MKYLIVILVLLGACAHPLSAQRARVLYMTDDRGIHTVGLEGGASETLIPVTINEPHFVAVDESTGKIYWTDTRTHKIQRVNADGSNVEDLVITGLVSPEGIALDVANGKMYWADSGTDTIYRANLDGSAIETLVSTGLGVPSGLVLDLSAQKMYWTDVETAKIQRANLDGSSVEDIITTGVIAPLGITIDNTAGKIYWTDQDANTISRANLDGSTVESLVSTNGKPKGIALNLSAGKMYWAEQGSTVLHRANLDGSSQETIDVGVTDNSIGVAINTTTNKIYWADLEMHKIRGANLDGSAPEVVVSTVAATLEGIALDKDAGLMYWTDSGIDKIQRSGLDGGVIEELVSDGTIIDEIRLPEGLALDIPGGKMYWTDWREDQIRRANLDGSDMEILVSTGLATPEGIALDTQNGKMYWVDWGLDTIQRANFDGSNVETLIASNLIRPQGIALDVPSGHMYFTDETKIQRANLDGSNIVDLVTTGVTWAERIRLDLADGKMYWTDEVVNDVFRANLDGSNVEALNLNDFVGLEGLAILFNEVPVGLGMDDLVVNEDNQDAQLSLYTAFDDPDDADAELAFSIQSNSNGALFSSAFINNTTGELQLDFTPNANGAATFIIRATDPIGDFADISFTVTVNPVNDAPGFVKGPNQNVNSSAGPQTIQGWATGLSAGPPDEVQTLTFEVTNDNNALFSVQPAISSTGTLTFTPASGQDGTALVDVVLKDNGGTNNGGQDASLVSQFSITVTTQESLGPVTGGISDRMVLEDADNIVISLFDAFDDPDNPDTDLSFSVLENSNSALFSSLDILGETGTFILSFAPDANGVSMVIVQAMDPGALTAQASFTVTVADVNDPPAFTAGPNITVPFSDGAQIVPEWATGLSPGPADEAGQVLTFDVTPDNTALFDVQPSISSNGTLIFTPKSGQVGLTTVNVVLRDNGGTDNGGQNASASQNFTITITSPESTAPIPPSIPPNQAVLEDAPNTTIRLFDLFEDPDNTDAELTFTITANSNPSLFSSASIIPSTGDLILNYAPDTNGSATINVRATDPSAQSAETSFTVSVDSVNDPPLFEAGTDLNVPFDAGLQTIPGWATGISAGPPDESNQSVSFSVTPEFTALFSQHPAVSPDGTLSFNPIPGQIGTANLTVTLMDTGGTENGGIDQSISAPLSITLSDPASTAPITLGLPDQIVLEDSTGSSIALFDSFNDPDDPDSTLSLFIEQISDTTLFSEVVIDTLTGVLNIAYAPDKNGTSTIRIRATDPQGESVVDSLLVDISPVNDPPGFTAGEDVRVLASAGPQEIPGWATNITVGPEDESSQSVTFDVEVEDPSLFVEQPTISPDGTLTFIPADDRDDSSQITVVLNDNGGTSNGGQSESDPVDATITVFQNPVPIIECPVVVETGVRQARLSTAVAGSGIALSIRFDYDETIVYEDSVGVTLETTSAVGVDPVGALITGLDPNTTYHFRAIASNMWGSTVCNDQTFTTQSYPGTSLVSVFRNFGDYTDNKNYQLVSLPSMIDIDIQNTFEGVVTEDWNAFYDNGRTGSSEDYFELYDGTPKFRFRPGRGFWVLGKQPWRIEPDSMSTVDLSEDDTYPINVHAGWNIIGNPYNKTIAWNDVLAANGLTMADTLYAWDDTAGRFEPATSMEAYKGYYYRSPEATTLAIPYILLPAEAVPASASKHAFTPSHSPTRKTIGIGAFLDGQEAARSWIVFLPGATEGLDLHDHYAPRTDFAGTWLGIRSPEQGTHHDLLFVESRPELGEGQVFDLVLSSDNQNNDDQNTVILHLQGLDAFDGTTGRLIDASTGETYELDQGVFHLGTVQGVRTMRLLIGTNAFLEEETSRVKPAEFELLPNFPNPFRAETVIEFSLPEESDIRMEVFDVLGRRVRLLAAERKEAGFYRMTWDGRNDGGRPVASGIYFYRLDAGSTVLVKKMVRVE